LPRGLVFCPYSFSCQGVSCCVNIPSLAMDSCSVPIPPLAQGSRVLSLKLLLPRGLILCPYTFSCHGLVFCPYSFSCPGVLSPKSLLLLPGGLMFCPYSFSCPGVLSCVPVASLAQGSCLVSLYLLLPWSRVLSL